MGKIAVAVLATVCAVLFAEVVLSPSEGAPQRTWEYKVQEVDLGTGALAVPEIQKVLTEAGREGWELVGFTLRYGPASPSTLSRLSNFALLVLKR